MRTSYPFRSLIPSTALLIAATFLTHPLPTLAQQTEDGDWSQAVRIVSEPAELELEVGEEAWIQVHAQGSEGSVLEAPVRLLGPQGALRVTQDGRVLALEAGEHEVVATLPFPPEADRDPLQLRIPVHARWPSIQRIGVDVKNGVVPYAGTTVQLEATGYLPSGDPRDDLSFEWESQDPSVAQVDPFGRLTARTPGTVTVTASSQGVQGEWTLEIPEFPGAELELVGGEEEVRTGDVQRYEAVLRDSEGREIEDVAVHWSLAYDPPEAIVAPPAPGQVDRGRVVADVPGIFSVVAQAGPLTARSSFRATEREVVQQLEVVGQGRESRVRTTDFWVFEGHDGRDYALSGAKRADGHAFVWDVTDPANIFKTDSLQVDARSVNDLKVSPDGRYATLTREGASDRRNGLVLLDLSDPAHPVIASEVVEGLTGGVHNAFPTDDHVFALSAGEKYLILDVRDIYDPRYVSEVQHEDCRIHDVWVRDGLAFSAQWACGLIVYDVGHGGWGGSVENPVFVSQYIIPDGRTHAAFPYHQESTGRTYVFVGDEIMSRRGRAWEGVPGNYQIPFDPETGEGGTILSTQGYIQVIDFTDPEDPHMVARYEVPEYGTHNIWVEDDVLYQAYYEGGLRVVDVSGELMGNLYTQGREIAVYKSADPIGYVPNSPMVWSAQPHKGHIFFTDTNSGLWSVRLHPRAPLTP